MDIRNLVLIFVTALLPLSAFSASADRITVKRQSATSQVFTITFPEAELQSFPDPESGQPISVVMMQGLPLLEEEGFPRVPYLNKMFSLPAREVTYSILKSEKETIPVENYFLNIIRNKNNLSNQNQTRQNKELVTVAGHGLFRDTPMFSLTVFPVSLDPSGKNVDVLKSLTIEVRAAGQAAQAAFVQKSRSARENAVLDKLYLNSATIDYAAAPLLVKSAAPSWPYKPNRYKLLVNQTGLYKITYADMVEAKVPVDQFDTRKLILTNKGTEIPLFFKGGEDGRFDPGDYFEFWGNKNEKTFLAQYADVYHDPFTDVNVYWLGQSSGNGLRMAEESGALTVTNTQKYIIPFAYTDQIHFEEDNTFLRFGQANTDSVGYTMDHWFFDRGVTAIGSRTYEAYLPWPYKNLSSRSVFVRAMMRGLSLMNSGENHQVQIWLNEKLATASGPWRDQEAHLLTNQGGSGLSQTDINNGPNDFRIVMDQAGVTDITLLNWFEITYERRYRAFENKILFRKQKNIPDGFVLQFEVDGFNSREIEVYKRGVSKIVNGRIDYFIADDAVKSYRISFQDEVFYPDIEYVALTSDQKKKPLKIIPDKPWQPEQQNVSLFDVSNRAEYLIITNDLLYLNALQLKSYRENNGLSVAVVKVEDIYDEFNYGIKSPLAIRDFLRYVYSNWDPSHRLFYVALVGDATYDYRNSANDLVPTFLFDTEKYGAAASDHQYALISGNDQTPDLAIGRWPVSTNAEFTAYFDKLKAYEAPSNMGEWRNRGLFISGNDASTFELFTGLPAFRAQNQRLISMNMPNGFFTRKLNTVQDATRPGGDPNFGSTPTLIDYFDEGVALINFLGHGGGGIWADVGLFNTTDIPRLNNGSRLPFIKSMTCFTGAFESASISGVAEELIVTPDKGAIGIFAASGVGWLHNDFAVGWTLSEFLLAEQMTVGEAVLYTKIFYLNNNLYVTEDYDTVIPSYFSLKRSMVNHYNLLGDPYVKITVPDETLDLSVNNSIPSAGDTLLVNLTAPFTSGSGRIELTNEKHEPLAEAYVVIANRAAQTSFVIPEELEKQQAFIKAYASDNSGSQDGRGLAKIAVNQALLDSLVILPARPTIGDEIVFSAHMTSPVRIERVRIKNLRGPTGQIVTLDLSREGETIWKTAEPFGPYLFADTVFFDIQMDDTTGATYLSRRHQLMITDPRPDLRPVANSLEFGGLEQIALSLGIENNSDSLLSQVQVSFFTDSISASQPPFRTDLMSFNLHEIKSLDFPADPLLFAPGRQFFAVIDALYAIEERNETNNFISVTSPEHLYNVLKNTGTTRDGVTNDTLDINEFTRYVLPPQALSASTVLAYKAETDNTLFNSGLQPGLTYINPQGQTKPLAVSLTFRNPAAVQSLGGYLEFSVDSTRYEPDYLEAVAICRHMPSLNRWLAINSTFSGDKLFASVTQTGLYALFHLADVKLPVIEITVNGRTLHEDMLVPQNPSMAFILQDENGVDLSSGFNVYIDDKLLTGEDLNMPDSVQNANAISLIAKPSLAAGNHNLRAEVTDAFGNRTEKILNFKVAEGFDIQIYGNYPNPFQEVTVFSFLIVANDILDKFSIAIYTVAGRKIREINRPQGADEIWDPGYHELEWDGRDKEGALVANGVYFALIKADFKGRTYEQTMKVAKLR